MDNYDFSGWATKANIKCSDGRTIMKDAFKHNDGATVPLVWSHQHNDPNAVLGHALLENRDEGVYAYCKLNDTENGKTAKLLVQHGDVNGLSIYANQLKENLSNVIHGNIRELSLVLASANPAASIDNVIMHGDESEEEAIIYNGETELYLAHSDEGSEKKTDENEPDDDNKDEKTVGDVLKTMNEEQREATLFLINEALESNNQSDEENPEGGNEMKHNVFENDNTPVRGGVLSHSDQEAIIRSAKKNGSFRAALDAYIEDNALQHADVAPASGFDQNTANEGNVTTLFPEYHDVKPGAPELITNDQGWITGVLNKVHKSPFSRIRTNYVDIRNAEALRAKGYKKGTKKGIVGNYNLARRTTDPQTVFVKSALHRDDINDIIDFDIIGYQYNIDKQNLNEELATAIMFGDGREVGDEGKIEEDKIRPIWKDDDLYCLHYDIDLEAAKSELQGTGTGVSFGENYIASEAMINAVLYAREKFKGTGVPDMYITPHQLNVMLLARDMNGRRIYSSVSELATSLNVGKIHTVEQMEGKIRTAKGKTKKLLALIVNLADYSLGATKGGEVTHFTQFDIDFNQEKSLLETRCSGALTKLWSALAIEEDVTAASGSDDTTEEEAAG